VGTLQDITEQKQAEAEKERLELQLRQAHKMEAVGTLAGGVAHDFNNLLQAIQGYAELLLLEKKKESREANRLREIQRAAGRGAELTKQLLTFSRRVESKLRPTDLNKEVEQVCRLLERTLPKMIEINTDLEDELQIVKVDSGQIEQILMNLAVNARDAMPEGGRLSLRTANVRLDEEFQRRHPEVPSGDYVVLSASDTGCGIDPEVLPHVFDPFFTTKEVGKGTGLGLAMVYGIVKSHGGYVFCNSALGRGTRFDIYLPVLDEIPEKEETTGEAGLPSGNETVLVVDDEAAVRDYAKSLLTRFGYSVITAENGSAALDALADGETAFDLVILDLIMPGMSGRQCLEKILATNPDARVLVASGFASPESREDVFSRGAWGCLDKPYNMQDFLRKVREVLDRPASPASTAAAGQ
jgi:nitrogen-specific signal transduction histidine kinase/CheY-like chemotaxis protein